MLSDGVTFSRRRMNTIAELEPDKFEQEILQFPRSVGRERNNFVELEELSNWRIYRLKSPRQNIQIFVGKYFQAVDLTSEDWHVETAS